MLTQAARRRETSSVAMVWASSREEAVVSIRRLSVIGCVCDDQGLSYPRMNAGASAFRRRHKVSRRVRHAGRICAGARRMLSDGLTVRRDAMQEEFFLQSQGDKTEMATQIKFGTSGWRAIVADEFTVANVKRAVTGIARYVAGTGKADPRLVVGRDPRFMARRSWRCG